MVRINLIYPNELADQHLIAEYNEILMLIGYVKKYPKIEGIPERYTLGKGHIKFFKNKLKYLKNRHEKIKMEMKNRGFLHGKKINLSKFDKSLIKDWKPSNIDKKIICKRIIEKIRNNPNYYRYYGERKNKIFFESLLNKY